jgi:peptidoglycan/LPS O-acetylase OafA/YrhL
VHRTDEHTGAAGSRPGGSLTSHQGNAANHGERRLSYQPALDGIRALAVGAVLCYHAGLPWARGGFLGVDAFFVLSGYLISSLLLLEWRSRGSIALSAFWARRARRLLPALFLMLTGVAGYALVFASPQEVGKLRGDALATIGYVANWRPLFSGQSYFDQFAIPSPLRHTWSLAIEEQWYAFWPPLLLVLLWLRRGSLRSLLAVSLLMIAGSAFLMGWLYHPGTDPSRVYYGTDTRAQSLLIGAALSMLLLRYGPLRSRPAGHMLQIAALLCAVSVGWVWATTSGDSVFLYRGGFLLLAAAVAVVIAASVQPKVGPIGRLLSLPPLRGLGLISYGVYLWHWPIYLVLTPDRTGWNGYGLFAVRVLVTLAIAVASYRLIEMPIRRGALRQWRASWTLAPATAAVVAVALVLVTRGGAPAFSLSTSLSGATPPIDSISQPLSTGANVSRPTRVLVLGDSVALTAGMGFGQVEPVWGLSVLDKGGLGCGFLPGTNEEMDHYGRWSTEKAKTCREWRSGWSSDVDTFQPDVVVLLFGPWDTLDLKVGDSLLEVGSPEWQAYAMEQLSHTVDVVSARGAKVMLLTSPCFSPRNLGIDAPAYVRLNPERVDELNDLYWEFARQHADQVVIVDLNRFACPEGDYTDVVIDGVHLREDGVHFTPEGSELVAQWLAPQIVAVAEGHRPTSDISASGGASVQGESLACWLDVGSTSSPTPNETCSTLAAR